MSDFVFFCEKLSVRSEKMVCLLSLDQSYFRLFFYYFGSLRVFSVLDISKWILDFNCLLILDRLVRLNLPIELLGRFLVRALLGWSPSTTQIYIRASPWDGNYNHFLKMNFCLSMGSERLQCWCFKLLFFTILEIWWPFACKNIGKWILDFNRLMLPNKLVKSNFPIEFLGRSIVGSSIGWALIAQDGLKFLSELDLGILITFLWSLSQNVFSSTYRIRASIILLLMLQIVRTFVTF